MTDAGSPRTGQVVVRGVADATDCCGHAGVIGAVAALTLAYLSGWVAIAG